MEKRAMELLREVILQPGISVAELSAKKNLTKSKVEYALKKSTQFLISNGYENFEKVSNRLYVSITMEEYINLFDEKRKDSYYSDSERKKFIILKLILQEDLSLNHFSIDLYVSKNTILKDLKEIESSIREYRLEIKYSRKSGYLLIGKEIDIRRLLIDVIRSFSPMDPLLTNFVGISKGEVENYKDILMEIERTLNIRFADESISFLPRMIKAVTLRTYRNLILNREDMPDIELIRGEKNFEEVYKSLKRYQLTDKLNFYDTSFLVIQILGEKLVISNLVVNEQDIFYIAIKEMVRRFENAMAISLSNKKDFYCKLYRHILSGNYRIKYGVPLICPQLNEIKKEYGILHSLVKNSIFPVEKVMGYRYSEDELVYITMYFLGAIKNMNTQSSFQQLNAIVICENGVSVSFLLTNELKGLFPEINFLGNLSIRSYEMQNIQADIIFSTVYIETESPLFLVTPFLTDNEKQRLRQRVFYKINQVEEKTSNPSAELMKIIQKNADIKNPEILEKNIASYLEGLHSTSTSPIISYSRSQPNLNQLLIKETVQVAKKTLNFEESIKFAAKPLIDQNIINESYIDKILASYEKGESYFIISPKIAIPHSTNEGDVHKLGMSFLKLKEPVYFKNEGHSVENIIIIAPVDKDKHKKAILQLHNILLDRKQELSACDSEEAIVSFFK